MAGGGGTDTGDYGAATTPVIASLVTATATGGAGSDVLSGVEEPDRRLRRGIRSTGDGGPNALNGGSSNDLLAGGPDDDVLTGGSGTDTADFSEAASAVVVNLASGSATGEGSDTLVGILNVIGGTGDDGLTGDTNANVLSGGAGADTLAGGLGNDTLAGGTGADTVDYASVIGDVTVNLAAGTATGDGTDTLKRHPARDGRTRERCDHGQRRPRMSWRAGPATTR